MILKRLKLFATIQMGNGLTLTVPDNYVPEPGSGYTFPLADELANKQTGLVPSNSNTGLVKASGGGQPPALTGPTNNRGQLALPDYTNNRGQLALPDYTNKQNGTNTGANAANSGSVMQKQTDNKPGVSTNNVKADKDALINNQIGDLKQQNSQLQSQLDAANKAKVESAARGRVAGRKQVGVWQGLQNTWNKAGTMKKIGMGGAALAGTYFLGKGLLGGNNNNDQ
jgi:hypothetical protein